MPQPATLDDQFVAVAWNRAVVRSVGFIGATWPSTYRALKSPACRFGKWVAADGPYNEHLMRDFGALNLALAVVTIAALISLTRPLVVTAALAWLAWSVPHTVYHFRHRDLFEDSDRWAAVGGLAVLGVIAILLLALPVRAPKSEAVEDAAMR